MSLTYYLFIAAGIILSLRALLIGIAASTNISRKLNPNYPLCSFEEFSDFQRVSMKINVGQLKCINTSGVCILRELFPLN